MNRIRVLGLVMYLVMGSEEVSAQPYSATDVDFDASGIVTFGDFVAFASAFGLPDPVYDVDGNGIVDFTDFLVLSEFYGTVILGPSVVGDTRTVSTPSGLEHQAALVPSGPFTMGSDSTSSNQAPMRSVVLDSFLIDVHEVTNERFAAFLNAEGIDDASGIPYLKLDGRAVQITLEGDTYAPRRDRDQNTPVVHVTWIGASAYCAWSGGRLPTEAEWEKVARGPDGRVYPWGNDLPHPGLLNYDMNVREPLPVGSYPLGVSPYGVHDMSGNVFEWVADYYDAEYYSRAPNVNPIGPESGQLRVIRGGAHAALINEWVQASYRQPAGESEGLVDLGFRCAWDP